MPLYLCIVLASPSWKIDSSSNEKCEYVNKGINWHNLGNQLCEIASAFEVSYAPYANMTEQQRHIYQVYKDLKIKSLALSRRDKTMVGLARTICRQLLLSTIWTLLRKIMWSFFQIKQNHYIIEFQPSIHQSSPTEEQSLAMSSYWSRNFLYNFFCHSTCLFLIFFYQNDAFA